MQLVKRLTAMILVMVLIVTTLSLGMTTLATLSVTPRGDLPLRVIVPESIYLQPGSNRMEFFFAGNISNPTAERTTTGTYSFSLVGGKVASYIAVSIAAASGTDGVVNATLSPDSAYNTSTFSGTLSDGYMPTPASDTLIWTFSYVVDGVTYTTKAYSYVWAPYLGQTGSHGNFTYKTTIGNEPKLNVYSFLVGIHSTDGGPYASKFTGTSGGYTMSPLVPGWGGSNVPPSNDDNFALDGIIPTYFESNAHGGVTHVQEGRERSSTSGTHAWGNTNGYGVLTLDTSRFKGAKFSDIPNFAAGIMIFGNEHAGENHIVQYFKMTGGGKTVDFCGEFSYESGGRGLAYGLFAPSNTELPEENTDYTVTASYKMRRLSAESVTMVYTFGLHLRYVNKTTLRKEVNSAVNANYQENDYEASAYGPFVTALREAAVVLGKPDVTENEILTATNSLLTAKQALPAALKEYSVKVTHKLPVSANFAYTYNGVTTQEENGFITYVQEQRFSAGATVKYGPNGYPGFTIDEQEQTRKNVHENIDVTYTYSPVKSKIYFNYIDSAFVTSQMITEMDVYYAQPYGTLPKPTMDGWRFNAWRKTGTNELVTGVQICTMIGDSLNLTADWSCYFTDGHGTANNPFIISTMTDLDNIDNAQVYCVNNGANGTAGKYYKQTTDLTYSLNYAAVQTFGGEYIGMGNAITIPEEQTITSSDYGSVFGTVTGGVIRDLTVEIHGTLDALGMSGSTGFIGVAQQDSRISNVQVVFDGVTNEGVNSGVLIGKVSNTEIFNCSVDVCGGTVGGDAFIGNTTGGMSQSNVWTLVEPGITVPHVSSINVMYARENITAMQMQLRNQRYEFTATAGSGWNVEYRNAAETAVYDESAVYTAPVNATGCTYYACAVKDVTFAAGNNGTLVGEGSYSLRQGQTVTGLKPTPNRGYRFLGMAGWSIERTNGTLTPAGDGTYNFTMRTLGGVLTADFVLNQYTVIYDANDGPTSSMPATASYDADKPITILAPSTVQGWDFSGWNTKSGGDGVGYTAGQTYSALTIEDGEEIILYAQWNELTYTAQFDSNGGTPADSQTVTYGGVIVFPNTTLTGYTLLGWKSSTGDGPYQPGENRNLYASVKYTAQWTPIVYTVMFSADGAANVPASVNVAYNSGDLRLTDAYIPEKAGYEFRGWDTREDGTGDRYMIPGVFPGNQTTVNGKTIILYAQWKNKDFTVTWNLNGGTLDGDTPELRTTVTFMGVYTVPKDSYGRDLIPEMETKHFKGWYLPDGTKVEDGTTVLAVENPTISAQWEPAVYTIHYDANGGTGTMPDQDVVYGSGELVFAQNAFVRDGFTFKGWKTKNADGTFSTVTHQPGTTPAGDLTGTHGEVVTLYAQWQGKTFSVKYEMHGFGTFSLTPNVQMHDDADINDQEIYDRDVRTLRNVAASQVQEDGSVIIKGSKLWLVGFAFTAADEEAMQVAYYPGGEFFLTDSILKNCERDASGAIKLHVIWKRENHITWDLRGGTINDLSENPTTTVVRGSRYVLPVGNMMKSFHIYNGWYTEPENGSGVMVTNETVMNVNSDKTIYAHWDPSGTVSVTYTTEFYEQNVFGVYPTTPTRVTTNSVPVGAEPIEVTADTTPQTGFTFDERDTTPNVTSCTLTNDLTQEPSVMRVYFTRNQYSVAFDAAEGSGTIAPVTFYFEQTKPLPLIGDSIQRPGYSFKQWAMRLGGDPVYFLNGGALTMSRDIVEYLTAQGSTTITLSAEWDEGTYLLSYIDGYGGTVYWDNLQVGTEIPIPSDPSLPGRVFLGWDWPEGILDTLEMPSHDVIIVATWRTNKYSVRYEDGFDSALQTFTVPYGDPVPQPTTTPTMEGMIFTGWTPIPLTMPAQNITIKATWAKQKYLLTLTDGAGKTLFKQEFECGAEIPEIPDPTTEGRAFSGWETSIPTYMPAAHTEIAATWTNLSYWVVYYYGMVDDYGNDAELFSAPVEYGSRLPVPSTPQSNAYDFDGWDKEIPLTMPATESTEKTDALVFTATWKPKTFSIYFMDGKGGVISSAQYRFGDPVEAPQVGDLDDVVPGYTFGGWVEAIPETMPAHNVTINANLEAKLYKVFFDAQEEDAVIEMDPQEIRYKTTASALNQANCSRPGYTFYRWVNPETGATYIDGAPFLMENPSNVTLYAEWAPNTYDIEFRRGNASAGGDMSTMRGCLYDEKVTLYANEYVLPGWRFVGWEMPGLDELLEDQAVVTKLTENNPSVTLTAQWERETYTATFSLGDGTADQPIESIHAQYTDVVTLPTPVNPKLQNDTETRTFLGWQGDGLTYEAGGAYTFPSKNMTFTAVWSANYHDLDAMTTQIYNARRAGVLTASYRRDPAYAAGGDWAYILGTDGTYSWNDFDTVALNSAYYAAMQIDRSIPASRQSDVDTMLQTLTNALQNTALLGVELDYEYDCAYREMGTYVEEYEDYCPFCSENLTHSYSELLEIIDMILDTDPSESEYTSASVSALRKAVYGGGRVKGIVTEVNTAALKKPAQAKLEEYVDRLALAYHSTLKLKNADYSAVDTLIEEYLPATRYTAYDDLINYYEADGVMALRDYYDSINRNLSVLDQYIIDEEYAPELQRLIDEELVALRADYRSIYALILTIPKSEDFVYLSASTNDPAWNAWALENAGAISEAIDKEFLDARYEPNTTRALYTLLDNIDWELDVFSQSSISSKQDTSYASRLQTAISTLVRKTYSVTYLFNDGSEQVFATYYGQTVGGSIQKPMINPSRDGYDFVCWSYDAAEAVPMKDSDTITGNMTFYAIWDYRCTTIRFDMNGGEGTRPGDQLIEIGKTENLPYRDDFRMEGCVFIGWSEDPYATEAITSFTATEKKEIILYAIWAPANVDLIAREGSTTVIDREHNLVYGLAYTLREQELLENYLDVEGNGTIKVIYGGYIATGSRVQVTNNFTGEVKEYTLIIFGDLDGDGQASTEDIKMIRAHETGAMELDPDSPAYFAADMDCSGQVNSLDSMIMRGVINGSQGYNQATRKII